MRLKRGWPLLLLVVLLVALPILEVLILVQVAELIGLWATLATLVVHAVGGVLLVRHEGRRAWQALTTAYATGKVPTGQLADAALILVGGLFLLLPGYLTDVVGIAFLLRWTRPFARKMIAVFVARQQRRRPPPGTGVDRPEQAGDPVVIPGEVEPG